ncbi:MAG: hypothetical protein PVG66_07860 [Chromatiales bacterium]|jgi:hypothetical protein
MQQLLKQLKDSLTRQNPPLCDDILAEENSQYQDTAGISQNNSSNGFVPAFYNQITDEVVLSRFADGRDAPIHLIEGLPASWISQFNDDGIPMEAYATVTAGFFKNGRFYTRAEVAALYV